MNEVSVSSNSSTISQSLREYGRGVAGGLLFSLPLLYTMEMWWTGFIAPAWHLLLYVLFTFVVLLGYNRYAGLRHDASWAEVAIDSVEEMGLGLGLAAFMLWLLGRISPGMGASEILGKIVVEAMVVAIGVSVGTAQLGGQSEQDEAQKNESSEGEKEQEQEQKPHFGGQIVIAWCGAILIAGNVGPTEEIVMLGTEASSWRLLAIALVSLALGAGILFYSDFAGSQQAVSRDSSFDIATGIATTYAVALLASALILLFFNRFEGVSPFVALGQIVVLALPATLGASAGRLLLKGQN